MGAQTLISRCCRRKLFYLPQLKKENKNTIKLVALPDARPSCNLPFPTPFPSVPPSQVCGGGDPWGSIRKLCPDEEREGVAKAQSDPFTHATPLRQWEYAPKVTYRVYVGGRVPSFQCEGEILAAQPQLQGCGSQNHWSTHREVKLGLGGLKSSLSDTGFSRPARAPTEIELPACLSHNPSQHGFRDTVGGGMSLVR